MLPFVAIGLGLSIAGAASSFMGAQQANKANQASIAAQQQAEAVRLAQMKFDADRRRRQTIRQAIIARSQALAQGTAQGATGQGSSAMAGAFGQISGLANFQLEGINQNEKFGEQIFAANQQLFQAQSQLNNAKTTSALGQGLSSLGGAVLSNLGGFSRVFGGFGSGQAPGHGMQSMGGFARGMGPIY